LVVGGGGTILKTSDGGRNWIAQNSGTSETLWTVYFTDANIGWAVGMWGTVLKTTNGGKIWDFKANEKVYCLSCIYFADAIADNSINILKISFTKTS
jgi:photosystem II stability/assembly factor-like uncharacterized protein